MSAPWAPDPTDESTTDRHPVIWFEGDAVKPGIETVQRRHRERRDSEDDPRAEFVGNFLDREI